jgi:hypothetical protein
VFEDLTNAIGKVARDGPYLFIHIAGDFTYACRRYELRDRLVGLPNEFEQELFGLEALWIRSRLIALFGVNQPTGHCLQTILNFQIGAIDTGSKSELKFIPFLLSDTRDGEIGDFGYDGEPALMFQKTLDEKTKSALMDSLVNLLSSEPKELGVFHDYMACEYDGTIESIGCDGQSIYREYLGYLFPPHSDDLCNDDDGWWPFELPRAKRRQNKKLQRSARSTVWTCVESTPRTR